MLTKEEEQSVENIKKIAKDGDVDGLIRLLDAYKAMCVPQNPHKELIRNGTFVVVQELINRKIELKNI